MFDVVNYIILAIVLLIVLYPMYFTVLASVSDPLETARGNVFLLPKGFTLEAYKNVFENTIIWSGYANTILYTVLATLINLICTIPCAYALSHPKLPFRRTATWFFVFTMYFSGGMIPTYLVVQKLGLIDSRAVLILINAVVVYFLIIAKNFYNTSIPGEIYEAASIDGASELGIFFRIALPLSTPLIALLVLYYAVTHWNDYMNSLLYLNSESKFPLQLVLRNILMMNQNMSQAAGMMADDAAQLYMRKTLMAETMKYSLIFISSFPVMIAYAFVQKYFIKGVTLGAVKG